MLKFHETIKGDQKVVPPLPKQAINPPTDEFLNHSINSSNFQNYIFEAQGGGAGGAGLFQGTGGTGGAGGNGSLIYGSQYQNVGAFVFDPNLNGQGAAVILRW